MVDKAAPSEYLVISRGQWDKNVSPEEIQNAIDNFYLWHDRLVDVGKMKAGQRLAPQGKTVSRKSVMDGRSTETKELVGGYWFIFASSFQDAAKIAADEIRPIDPERASAMR